MISQSHAEEYQSNSLGDGAGTKKQRSELILQK